MKLSCSVIEDMLPMYYDGICSEESATLVEAHLKDCAQCSRVLSDLHTGINLYETIVDDMKPLHEIKRRWKKSKRVYIGRGVCITLATLFLLGVIVSGIWYFSYAKYYFRLVRNMEHTSAQDAAMTSADYTLEKDGYRFDVNIPIVLSNSAYVRVTNHDGLVLFLYPEAGGKYTFWFYITDDDNHAYTVYLKSDMTVDFENHQFPVRGEKEQTYIQGVLAARRSEITAMLQAVYALWGIDLLDYATQ